MFTLHHALITIAAALPAAILTSCNRGVAGSETPDLVAMEKAGLDRWSQGDTQAVLDLYAPDITYFDPYQEKRVDGLEAMKALYRPFTGQIRIDHYEMIGPKVQHHGEVAVLTYNLLDHVVHLPSGPTSIHMAWNVTTVYARLEGQWKVVHSHFSYIQGKLPVTEQ